MLSFLEQAELTMLTTPSPVLVQCNCLFVHPYKTVNKSEIRISIVAYIDTCLICLHEYVAQSELTFLHEIERQVSHFKVTGAGTKD